MNRGFALALLVAAILVPTLLASNVVFSTSYENYGVPSFIKLEFAWIGDQRVLTSSEFKPLAFLVYLTISVSFSFFAGIVWQKRRVCKNDSLET